MTGRYLCLLFAIVVTPLNDNTNSVVVVATAVMDVPIIVVVRGFTFAAVADGVATISCVCDDGDATTTSIRVDTVVSAIAIIKAASINTLRTDPISTVTIVGGIY